MFNFLRRKKTNTVIARKRILRKLYLSRMQLTSGLLIIFCLLIGYTFFVSGVFKLHTIKFIPNELNCTSTEKIRAIIPRGNNLLFLNTSELSVIIKSKFPCFFSVEV